MTRRWRCRTKAAPADEAGANRSALSTQRRLPFVPGLDDGGPAPEKHSSQPHGETGVLAAGSRLDRLETDDQGKGFFRTMCHDLDERGESGREDHEMIAEVGRLATRGRSGRPSLSIALRKAWEIARKRSSRLRPAPPRGRRGGKKRRGGQGAGKNSDAIPMACWRGLAPSM